MSTETASPAPDDMSWPPGDDVGIPNVADVARRRVTRRIVVSALSVLGIVVAVGAATAYKLAQRNAEREAARPDTGPKPVVATAPLTKQFEALPRAAAASGAPGPAARASYLVPAVQPLPGENDPDATPPVPLASGARPARGHAATQTPQPPEDAPMMLAAAGPHSDLRPGSASGDTATAAAAGAANDEVALARQRLRGYQQQLGAMMSDLSRTTSQVPGLGAAAAATPLPTGAPDTGMQPAASPPGRRMPPVLGLEKSGTPTVLAGQLPQRSLLMPKGTAFTCSLKTRVISAVSGMVSCITARHLYSDDGRVLLVERGSHLDGEYRITTVRPGVTRIPVLWTRLRTPHGITVDLDSPGTGALGESGIDGHVNKRWGERIGAALLLSFIDDLVRIEIADRQANATTIYGGTLEESSQLAEKVLESTINIPPLIQRNQGASVGVYVARDVDFSAVYALRPDAGR